MLPESGAVYVDTQILIYAVERHPVFSHCLRPFWTALEQGGLTAHSSELILLETRVAPLKNRDVRLLASYDELFNRGLIRLHPISRTILLDAAALRAEFPVLRTPDAIHAATAMSVKCVALLTNDPVFQKILGVKTLLLSELVST